MNRIAPVVALASVLALGACSHSVIAGSQNSYDDTRAYVLEACPGEVAPSLAAAASSRFTSALRDFRTLDSTYDLVHALPIPPERASDVVRLREWRFASVLLLSSLAATPNSGATSAQSSAARNLQEADTAYKLAEAALKRAIDDGATAEVQSQFRKQLDDAKNLRAERWDTFHLSIKARDNANLFALPVALGVAVASAVIPALVDVSLDLVAAAVREASKDSTKSATAITVTHLHGFPQDSEALPNPALTVNPAFGCLVVIRGKFTAPVELDTVDHTQFQKSAGIKAENDLYFYLSAKLEFSNDNSAFRLAPTFVWIKNYIDERIGGASPEVVVNVTVASARTARDAAPIAITTLALPRVRPNAKLDAELLAGMASAWTAFPGGDAVAKDALQGLEKAHAAVRESAQARQRIAAFDGCRSILNAVTEGSKSLDLIQKIEHTNPSAPSDCWPYLVSVQRAALDTVIARAPATRNEVTDKNAPVLAARVAMAELYENAQRDRVAMSLEARRARAYRAALEATPLFTPVTIEVDIIENRKGSPFMKVLADVLDKSKKDVGDALVASLSPAERAKRRADEEQQTRTNRAAVATAQDLVRQRQAELDDLPSAASRSDRVRAENALRQAKIAANNAYVADGRGIPYPEAQP